MSSNPPTYRLRTRPIKREDATNTPPDRPSGEAVTNQPDQDHGQTAPANPDEPPAIDRAPYKVGYKKPPLHTRFKKGVCPNPKGRPKGAKDLRTRILEAANEKVQVRENGRMKRMSKFDIGAKKAINKFAETGDLKWMALALKIEGPSSGPREGSGSGFGSAAEQEKPNTSLLQWFLDQNTDKSGSDGEGA